jgi:hypothetical protein
MILAQLLRRPGRSAALFVAVLLATTGFLVLTGRPRPHLVVLIAVVGALFLANAAAVAVGERSRELAVLACLGWARRSLAVLVLGEVCLVGFLAGAISVMLAGPVGQAVHVEVRNPWLAVPVALGLCFIAAALPALRASRAHPAALTHRSARAPRLTARPRPRVIDLAAANLGRCPGRTILGAACLAVGVGGLTVVVATALHGPVNASVLGDTVAVPVTGADVVAVVAAVAIGVVAVADVLQINTRDRAGELAALRATGWSDAAVMRLVAYEGLGIGIIGVGAGVAAGLCWVAEWGGKVSGALALAAVASAVAGSVAVCLAAAVPAVLQRRTPMSVPLAEE